MSGDDKRKTVGELLDLLQEALATGKCTRETPCATEGCDCIGPCSGIQVGEIVVFTRDNT
jgi:hypothetical protein